MAMTAAAAAAAAPADAAARAANPPAGQLLIAAATIEDPRFYHAVIVLVHHDRKGAFGIMINRPLGERRIADLLAAPGKNRKDAGLPGKIEVFLGGPVQTQLGFVVHTADYHRPQTLAVGAGLAMTADPEVLRDIAHHKGPAKYLFALGYAGWGAGQLEAEIARHDWFTTPADPALVFDADRSGLWEKALARRTRNL